MAGTNGASLEDCQSNVFVLAELNGLRWKKFVAAGEAAARGASDLASDPILWAYGACLAEGLLAVWRRAPKPNASLALAADKELWVFWYSQEEPKELAGMTSNLTNSFGDSRASGSWSEGIHYDTRCLLFKALHNLIERNLFAAGYQRLGKWFLMPVDHENTVAHVDAFNFSFFVQGDVYVCAAVNTQRQTPVFRLSRAQLRPLKPSPEGKDPRVEVVLAPWSWVAVLNVRDALGESSETGAGAERRSALGARQYREWSHFFPLPRPDATENLGWVDPDEKEKTDAAKADAMNQMVEVAVGGIRMLYPSSYVLLSRPAPQRKPAPKTGASPGKRQPAAPSPTQLLEATGRSLGNCPLPGSRLVHRAVEDLTLTRPGSAPDLSALPSGSQTPGSNPPTPSATEEQPQWDSADPTARESCACGPSSSSSASAAPSPSAAKSAPSPASKGAQKFGVGSGKEDRKLDRKPFHRRSPLTVQEETKSQPASGLASSGASTAALPTISSTQSATQPALAISPAVTAASSAKPSPAPPLSISGSLPPHEPITQMISPVPSAQDGSSAGDQSAMPHFTLPSTSKPATPGSSAAGTLPPGLARAQAENRRPRQAKGGEPGPRASAGRPAKAPRQLKRPLLAELDAYLATAAEETLPQPKFLYGWDARSAPWDCPESPPVQTAVAALPPPHHVPPFVNHMDKDLMGPCESDLKTSSEMPADFMDTSAPPQSVSSENNFEPHLPWISPPASNERDPRAEGKGTNGTAALGLGGPPSVGPGPYANPYPTPPTPQPWISPPASNERDPRAEGKGTNGTAALGLGGPPSVGPGPYANPYPTPPTPQVATSPESLQARVKEAAAGAGHLRDRLPEAPTDQDDTKRVYHPPKAAHYQESNKYGPLTALPRSSAFRDKTRAYSPGATVQREERPGEAEERALAQRLEAHREATGAGHFHHMLSGNPLTPRSQHGRAGPGTSPYAASQPSPYNVAGNPKTPLNAFNARMDIHSPLSNSSMLRNVNSVEPVPSGPEAHGLVAAVLLSDTPINLHRDTIFDSCPACACSGLNITGSEAGAYVKPGEYVLRPVGLEPGTGSSCQCGFSAVRYRILAYGSGLFIEDEAEATEKWRNVPTRRPPPSSLLSDPAVLNLLRHQSMCRDLAPAIVYPSCASAEAQHAYYSAGIPETDASATQSQNLSWRQFFINREEVVALMEGNTAVIDAACLVMDCTAPAATKIDRWRQGIIDVWGLRRVWNEEEPGESEALSTVKAVGSVVEKAMGCVRGLAASVDGPLTWRSLVHKAGKEEDAGPEPLPQVLLTAEKDLMALSPLSLRLWDKLLLDPYSSPKDVVYVAVVPENPHIFARSQIFFRELSKTYEGYRFGRHCPFTKALPRDGILAVSSKLVSKNRAQLGKDAVAWLDDPEFQHETPENKTRLRAYAQVCQSMLGQLLQNEGMNAFDRNIFRDVGKEAASASGASGGEAMPPPAGPEGGAADGASASVTDSADADAEAGKLPHVVVVYLVNPVLQQEAEGRSRLSLLALFRSYLSMVSGLPKHLLPFIQLEVVDLKTVLDCTAAGASLAESADRYVEALPPGYEDWRTLEGQRRLGPGERVWERRGTSSVLRNLALSVFAQPRNLSPTSLSATHAKCLTGLGPTASYLQTVSSRLKSETDHVYRMYSPPYILPPTRPVRELSTIKSTPNEGSVLYVSYCLSEKQHWLIVTATDHQGSMMDSSLINITTTDLDRSQIRSGDAIRQSLGKLWSFIIGVLATGCHPWRLVVGRLGRIGHGELRAWAQLLSKTNLKKTSSIIREQCVQCAQMPGFQETPAILSAALVSMEPESSLRLFPHVFKPDDRFGLSAKLNPLSTPEDASATHILVFPTSAFAQTQTKTAEEDDGGFDIDIDLNFGDDGLLDGIDVNDLGDPNGTGVPGSARHGPGFHGFFSDSVPLEVNNQPIALGYYVSTAPAHGLPSWFWLSASGTRRRSPVHLRAALHIHTARVQEEDLGLGPEPAKNRSAQLDHNHPLDSRKPPDVLRKILETYNALSWLAVDMGTGDRKSCLPVHIQALLRLYHATNSILLQ